VVTVAKDSDLREKVPVDFAGWILGEYLSKKKVLCVDWMDEWFWTDWMWNGIYGL
jgi:hypothetical protein